MSSLRVVGAISLAGAIPAAIGGLMFWALHGGTTATRAVAYGFWLAAALVLVLMAISANKRVWRSTTFPLPEGWVFVASAIVLTLAGAVIDTAGA